MASGIGHGFDETVLSDAGTWVKVFEATGIFAPGVRSIEAANLSTSANDLWVMPQYEGDGDVPEDGVDIGRRLEPGQSTELSAANSQKGRIAALWMRSDDATGTHGVTLL